MRKKRAAKRRVEYNDVTVDLHSTGQRLAIRAEVGAALPHNYTCNWRATFEARLTGTLVNAEIILKITSAIDPIDAGAMAINTILQDLADTDKEHPCLFFSEAVAGGEGVQSSQVQGFIHIDIAQASQKRLVEQQGLELAVGMLQPFKQVMPSEAFIQGLGTQITQYAVELIHQPRPAKLAGIIERQDEFPIQLEQQPVVGFSQGRGGSHDKVTTHSQVEE
jgi:hypothetical protein